MEDAETIFDDAGSLGLIGEDFAWLVTEDAFDAFNAPVGRYLVGSFLFQVTSHPCRTVLTKYLSNLK